MSISQELGTVNDVTLEQGTVRYRERGSGDPIVFVHGLVVNGDLWRKVVPTLSKDFRCITPDWPLGSHEVPLQPHADVSPPGVAALIADFLEALDLHGVTLVGNDTGGAICQMVVTQRPDRIARLVLTPCDAFEVFPPPPFNMLPLVGRIPGATFALAQSLRSRAVRRMPMAYGALTKRPLAPEISDSYARPCYTSSGVRRDLRKFLRNMSARQLIAAGRRLSTFDRPVLLAWSDDRFFKLDLARRLQAEFPNARLELIDDARAFVPEDQPERLAELIADFARQPAAQAA